jgi:hypothetical protein
LSLQFLCWTLNTVWEQQKVNSKTLTSLFFLCLITGYAKVSASTLEFRDGVDVLLDGASSGFIYNGTNDAELRSGTPLSNFDFGTGSTTEAEFTIDLSDGGSEAQVVLRFDNVFGAGPLNVPVGSVINSATLFIDIDNVGADLNLYQLSSDFGSESSVTWDSFAGGVIPGVNAGATPVATINGGGNKVTVDITSSVAAWAAGSTNFGWALVSTGNDGVDIGASENIDFTDRPQLFIDFTAPIPPAVVPLPPSALLALPALAFLTRARRS